MKTGQIYGFYADAKKLCAHYLSYKHTADDRHVSEGYNSMHRDPPARLPLPWDARSRNTINCATPLSHNWHVYRRFYVSCFQLKVCSNTP